MRILVPNEKKWFKILKEQYGIDVRFSDFQNAVVFSHRIYPKEAIIHIKKISDNKISVIYDDLTKYNYSSSKLIQQHLDYDEGGYTETAMNLIEEGILKDIKYNQLDEVKSEVIFRFTEPLTFNIDTKTDICHYLKLEKMYSDPFGIVSILRERFKDFKVGSRESSIRALLGEFLTNLVQHNYRKHNKYIDIGGMLE